MPENFCIRCSPCLPDICPHQTDKIRSVRDICLRHVYTRISEIPFASSAEALFSGLYCLMLFLLRQAEIQKYCHNRCRNNSGTAENQTDALRKLA